MPPRPAVTERDEVAAGDLITWLDRDQ